MIIKKLAPKEIIEINQRRKYQNQIMISEIDNNNMKKELALIQNLKTKGAFLIVIMPKMKLRIY